MSGGLDVLALQESDVTKMLSAGVHLGSGNADFQMLQYVYKRKTDGTHIINLKKTWEKLLLAARMIVSIENPTDVAVISGKLHAQRAILKFAGHTGATPIAGRFTPGGFTNQIQAAFREPRLLVISDPRIDHQAINEASYVNIPTIGFCNTDAPLRYIDVAIPCNTKAPHSIGLMLWILSREVLRMRGTIGRDSAWSVMPDLYFYRDPEEVEKEEREAAAAKAATSQDDWGSSRADAPTVTSDEWGDAAAAVAGQAPAPTDFGAAPTPAAAAAAAAAPPASAAAAAAPAPLSGVPADNWGAPTSSDWGAEPSEGTSTEWAAAASTTGGGDAGNW